VNLFGASKYFYDVEVFMDDLRVAAGINLLNHYKALLHYFQRFLSTSEELAFNKAPFEKQKTPAKKRTAAEPKQTGQSGRAVRWWDKNRMVLHGKVKVKLKKLALDILTHTNPVSEECLQLSMEMAYFDSNGRTVRSMIQDIYLTRLVETAALKNNSSGGETLGLAEGHTALFKVPVVEMVLTYDFNPSVSNDHYFVVKSLQRNAGTGKPFPESGYLTTKITLGVSFNIPNKDGAYSEPLYFPGCPVQKIIQVSHVPIIHYQAALIAELISLPQMSYEFLMLHGIRPVSLKDLDREGQQDRSPSNKSPRPEETERPKPTINFANSVSKQMIEGITQLFKNTELTEEFSNYLDLVTFTLNEQINSFNKENLFTKLEEIDVKVSACNVRLLMTNVEKTKNIVVQTRSDDRETYKLIGVQAVMKSINFQSEFYKKEAKIDKIVFENLLKTKGSKKLLRWASRQGKGMMSLVYAAFFDGQNLLSLRPLSFEEERLRKYGQSLENPLVFAKFFFPNADPRKLAQQAGGPEAENHLFPVRPIIDFLPTFMQKAMSAATTPKGKGLFRGFFSKEEVPSPGGFAQASRRQSKQLHHVNQDFDFSSVGGFFKAKEVIYKQQVRERFNLLAEDDSIVSGFKEFSNFITVSGCKLLIGQNLSAMGSLLVTEPLDRLKKKFNYKSMKTKKPPKLNERNHEKLRTKSNIALVKKQPNCKHGSPDFKADERAVYPFGIRIISPQVSIFKEELGSQILFTSQKGFLFYSRAHYLPFDFYQQDPKNILSFNCDDLGIFSGSMRVTSSPTDRLPQARLLDRRQRSRACRRTAAAVSDSDSDDCLRRRRAALQARRPQPLGEHQRQDRDGVHHVQEQDICLRLQQRRRPQLRRRRSLLHLERRPAQHPSSLLLRVLRKHA